MLLPIFFCDDNLLLISQKVPAKWSRKCVDKNIYIIGFKKIIIYLHPKLVAIFFMISLLLFRRLYANS